MGITFKENCPDIRNSKVPKIYNELIKFGLNVDLYDPNAVPEEVFNEFNIKLLNKIEKYELIILAVSHDFFLKYNYEILKKKINHFDLKSVLDKKIVDARL